MVPSYTKQEFPIERRVRPTAGTVGFEYVAITAGRRSPGSISASTSHLTSCGVHNTEVPTAIQEDRANRLSTVIADDSEWDADTVTAESERYMKQGVRRGVRPFLRGDRRFAARGVRPSRGRPCRGGEIRASSGIGNDARRRRDGCRGVRSATDGRIRRFVSDDRSGSGGDSVSRLHARCGPPRRRLELRPHGVRRYGTRGGDGEDRTKQRRESDLQRGCPKAHVSRQGRETSSQR